MARVHQGAPKPLPHRSGIGGVIAFLLVIALAAAAAMLAIVR